MNIEILKSISLEIPYGSFVALVGRSGSGKSTLMQLLLKFYNFSNGDIFINDRSITLIGDSDLRNVIGYVPQEPGIFSGTIKSNIAFSKPDASLSQIEEAAKLSGALDFIQKLPEGMNTMVGNKGAKLSGGQKQRIALSRAMLYKPQLLLLDEAMSALDSESEQKVMNMVLSHMQGNSVISIAHRVAAISGADTIFLLDSGTIVASGKHSSLLKSSDLYRSLCEEQSICMNVE
jgi:ATP-binding cassette subfamily B protein